MTCREQRAAFCRRFGISEDGPMAEAIEQMQRAAMEQGADIGRGYGRKDLCAEPIEESMG